MKKNMLNLTVLVIGVLLLSACAQEASAQPPAYPAPQDPAYSNPQQPAYPEPGTVVVVEGTSVPGVVSQPLTEITPEVPATVVVVSGGETVLTRDAKGQTITIAVGDTLLLKLGDEYTWDIVVSDESVLSRVKNIAVIKGAQGVYEPHKPGTVTISASGDPLCRQSKPACGMPSIQVEFTIVVK